MIVISALWIVLLLGSAASRSIACSTSAITSNFDAQLDYVLTAMIASSEIGPDGEVLFNRAARRPALPRALFGPLFPDHRRAGFEPYPVALALGPAAQRRAAHVDTEAHYYDSDEFPDREIAHHRARRPPARLAGALALPGRAEPRRARRADRRAPADDGPLVRRARPRPHPARRASRRSTACGRCAASAARSPRSARAASRGSRNGCRARSSR